MPRQVAEQRVMNFAQAQATAAEVMAWKRDLLDAQVEEENAKDDLKQSEPYRRWETAKERVKELERRIAQAEDHLVEGLANSSK